jgi:hypothetical protein
MRNEELVHKRDPFPHNVLRKVRPLLRNKKEGPPPLGVHPLQPTQPAKQELRVPRRRRNVLEFRTQQHQLSRLQRTLASFVTQLTCAARFVV